MKASDDRQEGAAGSKSGSRSRRRSRSRSRREPIWSLSKLDCSFSVSSESRTLLVAVAQVVNIKRRP